MFLNPTSWSSLESVGTPPEFYFPRKFLHILVQPHDDLTLTPFPTSRRMEETSRFRLLAKSDRKCFMIAYPYKAIPGCHLLLQSPMFSEFLLRCSINYTPPRSARMQTYRQTGHPEEVSRTCLRVETPTLPLVLSLLLVLVLLEKDISRLPRRVTTFEFRL